MALRKSAKISTFKGEDLSKIENYAKVDKGILAENGTKFTVTDIAEGTSADYGKFIILINDDEKTFFYAPNVDVDFYANLTDEEKEELTDNKEISIVARQNKKGNTYFVTEM